MVSLLLALARRRAGARQPVILVILALLVPSLTASLSLLATIALSTGTAIGLTNLAYDALLGQPLFSIVPVVAFIFLLAVG